MILEAIVNPLNPNRIEWAGMPHRNRKRY